MYTHILLTSDGSDLATKSVEHGMGLAKSLGARVTALTVIQPIHAVAPAEIMIAFPVAEFESQAKKHAENILQRIEHIARDAGVDCATRSITHDDPWRAIVDTASEENCDLIVVGSHGRTGLSKLVLGSEAQKVLTHTKIPVLVTR